MSIEPTKNRKLPSVGSCSTNNTADLPRVVALSGGWRVKAHSMTSKISVLVVDDELPLRDFVRKNLAARGFAVHAAANGLEALALFNTQPLDLIILDVM